MKCKDYKLDCRGQIFVDLHKIWEKTKKDPAWDTDIWRKANTAQALVQYWRTSKAISYQETALAMMGEAYQFYHKYLKEHTKRSDIWVDDFGWWGGFFVDFFYATRGAPTKPFETVNLLEETQYCYERMLKNQDTKDGGIWNQVDDNGHPTSDSQKNTVTNAWMLNLASDLFTWTKNPDYKKMAEAQYTWLTTGNLEPNKWDLYTPNGLLWWLPRPLNTGRQCQPGGSVECQYWSGDEGVFLRGITSYIHVDPAKKNELLRKSKKLIIAAITPTEDFSDDHRNEWRGFPDKQNVMHEFPASEWSNSNLPTGKGVFMRLVTRFAQQWNYFNDKEFEKTFKTFVNASAESAWCSRDTTGAIGPDWNPEFGPKKEKDHHSDELWPQVLQTNGLDVLNAAWQINPAD